MIAFAAAADTASETAAEASGLQEVIVTANRRAENIQDVPITIQAMTGDTLKQLNVTGFNDRGLEVHPERHIQRQRPGAPLATSSCGVWVVWVRATSRSPPRRHSPTWRSTSTTSRCSSRHVITTCTWWTWSASRFSEGPQGALFGGGAQAGAIRYITNKPKLGVTEGDFNAGYGITAGGDPNSSGNFTLNLPFGDHFAVRGVIFTEHRGRLDRQRPEHDLDPPDR